MEPQNYQDPTITVADPDNDAFIKVVKGMNKGDTLTLNPDEILELEHDLAEVTDNFEQAVNFTFHQRIFEPGVILKKQGSNARIFIPKERLDEVSS